MPIYEYSCTKCGHELEILQKMTDSLLKDCPECGQPTLKKQLSAAGFRLKGTGWYETDFKAAHKSSEKQDKEPAAPACGAGGCCACAQQS